MIKQEYINSVPKKAWALPELTLISQNAITGGGPRTNAKETAGTYGGSSHAVLFNGHKVGASLITYNHYVVAHS